MTGRLTGSDERVITQARELAGLHGIDAIRKHTGQADGAMALSNALGEAQYYLREPARIIGQQAGEPGDQAASQITDEG
jgi:hypothetical protein